MPRGRRPGLPRGLPRRKLAALLAGLLLGAVLLRAGALQAAHLVIDAGTGEVLAAQDPLALWHPASLTKMMTAYLAFEAIELGALSLDEMLPVSAHAAAQPPTRLGLDAGDRIAARDAIAAIIVRSANDAAVVLAEALAGSEPVFAERMTRKAAALGMTGTVFRNASGLPDPDQVTSARDMAVLARALIADFPQYYEFFAARSLGFRGRTLPTYNGLLVSYDGADGLKTGFTCASGYNVVISAERDGRRLIGVLLGSRSGAERSARMRGLLDAAFRRDSRGEAPKLTDLSVGEGGAARPPRVLSPDECGRVPGEQEVLLVRGPPAKVAPGAWGVALGTFTSRKEAQSRLRAARGRLGAAVQRGRPTLVEKRAGRQTRYAALLTGLSQGDAAKACRFLQAQKTYCVALGPDALRNPQARWW